MRTRSVPRSASPARSSWSTTTRARDAPCASTGAPPTRCTMRDCPRVRAPSARWRRSRWPNRRPSDALGALTRKRESVAKIKLPSPSEMGDRLRDTEVWKSIFRPGSIFRRGYKDTSRDRALATMNNVLYHLHPTKVKRHGLKLTYTFCLGGLSFFLFILLTITGILLMFFYRPMADIGSAVAYGDMQTIRTSVFFGDLVRNLHRWGAHLMVLSVTLHMARVFYTGAYKPPREFNWVVGVVLLFLTLGLSFTGYLLPWDQLSIWAVTVGTNLAAYSPLVSQQAKFILLGSIEVGPETLLRWYVLHVLALPFVLVIFLAVHFWRIRKDGGISGPL